jgi:hypothetical protein
MTHPHDARLACLLQLEAATAELHRQLTELTRTWAAPAAVRQQAYGPKPSVRRRLQMVEQLSKALRLLNKYGQLYRRAEAQALYAEGLTMAELASVFQVSRQRVAALLREPAGDSALP